MQRKVAGTALLYRRLLIITFVSSVLMVAGSVTVSAQEVTSLEATSPESTMPDSLSDEPRVELQQTAELPGPDASEGCDNPKEITTFAGQERRRTESFEVPTDVVRIRYFIEPMTTSGGFLAVDVLKEDDNLFFDGFVTEVANDPSGGSENILLDEPGSYYLEIDPFDVQYQIAVDSCGGDLPPQQGSSGNDVPDSQSGGSGNDVPGSTTTANGQHVDAAKVIEETISKKPLPNTGGIAILAPAAGLFLISGAVAGLLVRRRR
jgi:LPXTG-motif cell wall-anchored protein